MNQRNKSNEQNKRGKLNSLQCQSTSVTGSSLQHLHSALRVLSVLVHPSQFYFLRRNTFKTPLIKYCITPVCHTNKSLNSNIPRAPSWFIKRVVSALLFYQNSLIQSSRSAVLHFDENVKTSLCYLSLKST